MAVPTGSPSGPTSRPTAIPSAHAEQKRAEEATTLAIGLSAGLGAFALCILLTSAITAVATITFAVRRRRANAKCEEVEGIQLSLNRTIPRGREIPTVGEIHESGSFAMTYEHPALTDRRDGV